MSGLSDISDQTSSSQMMPSNSSHLTRSQRETRLRVRMSPSFGRPPWKLSPCGAWPLGLLHVRLPMVNDVMTVLMAFWFCV